MSNLCYHKWYFDNAQNLMDNLTDNQLGKLFRMTMTYAISGEEPNKIPAALRFPFAECKGAVDQSYSWFW